MNLESIAVPTAKTRKPRAVKTSTPMDVSRDKVTLVLSSDANLRLTIHAAALKLDRSALVEKLIREQLKRFVLQDRGDRDTTEDRQSVAVA